MVGFGGIVGLSQTRGLNANYGNGVPDLVRLRDKSFHMTEFSDEALPPGGCRALSPASCDPFLRGVGRRWQPFQRPRSVSEKARIARHLEIYSGHVYERRDF